ncbi:MAG: SDR family oxidoreductase [Rhodospirillales bacterium]|nr:SDR family oxidoreductase [Rhodospirillales bacterium]
MRLKDKVAIVTGGSSGIGREICMRYAAEGAKVAVVNRTRDKGAAVADEITNSGGTAKAFACDVSSRDEVQAMVRAVVDAFGTVDILVAAAGILINKPLAELSEEDWRATLDNNLAGCFFAAQAVAPVLQAKKAGKIILFGSIAGSQGYATGAAYCASKGGVLNLMRALAAELAADGINVNALSPGATATPMNAEHRADSDILALFARNTPTGRDFLPPADMAGTAVFLASDDARAVHGQNVVVDDGFSAVKPVG